MAMTAKGKKMMGRLITIAVLLAIVAGGGMYFYRGLAPEATKSVTLTGDVGTKDFDGVRVQAKAEDKITVAKSAPARVNEVEIRWGVIPWNSMAGINHANGGPVTMMGSIAQKYGLNLRIIPQDMYGDQRAGLIACATEMHENGTTECTRGYTHTAMMGDAAGWYMQDLNAELAKLGPEYQAEIIGGFGRSLGEDAFMGPKECQTNPDACRGLRFAGVQGDGDINCALSWAQLNNIPVNPNGSTYDPDALNWMYTGSFDEADKAYINDYCEELPVVRNGKLTGEKKNVCISGTATWTPGDVNVARLKGGIVKIYSTYENGGQMPNAVIGIKKWNTAHPDLLARWFAAGFEGGYEVRTSSEALTLAGQASYAIYQTEVMTAKDWTRYYKRRLTEDKTGQDVWLGGSQAFVLDEALAFYGVDKSAGEPFRRSYVYYGDLAVTMWPSDISSYPAWDDVFNPTYLEAAAKLLKGEERGAQVMASAQPDFTQANTGPTTVIGSRDWNIEFRSGSSEFDPSASKTLDELATVLILADNTRVEIHGHTDSQGEAEFNQTLSEGRAFSVSGYLKDKAPNAFREGRVDVFAHGESNPVAPNSTAQGRAQNRRVEVKVFAL